MNRPVVRPALFALSWLFACSSQATQSAKVPDSGLSSDGVGEGSGGDGGSSPPSDGGFDGGDEAADGSHTEDVSPPLPWGDDPCLTVDVGASPFLVTVDKWSHRDAVTAPPHGLVVAAGSSTVRRWEHGMEALASHGLVQRGMGGARLFEIAGFADRLILAHSPSVVVVFAGTNDLADGLGVDATLNAWRCLASRIHEAQPGTPFLWVGVTPTPARWSTWVEAAALNAAVADFAAMHPDLYYVDTPSVFLATGGPPDSSLFLEDGLHLSPLGYSLWESVVLPELAAVHPERPPPSSSELPTGTYIRVDLGPSNPEDGAPTPSVDSFGIYWNTWHDLSGGEQVDAGESLGPLVSTTGSPTAVYLHVAGGFRANGFRNGGLLSPSGSLLGTMAVAEATGDFFYTGDPDDPGALAFSGLDPRDTYRLRLFASRADSAELRTTRFRALGAHGERVVEIPTTGSAVGHSGYPGNDSTVGVLEDLRPDAWGQLYLDVEIVVGSFAYLNLLELEVQSSAP
jgi:lysophospholipase L1-like esterase